MSYRHRQLHRHRALLFPIGILLGVLLALSTYADRPAILEPSLLLVGGALLWLGIYLLKLPQPMTMRFAAGVLTCAGGTCLGWACFRIVTFVLFMD